MLEKQISGILINGKESHRRSILKTEISLKSAMATLAFTPTATTQTLRV
jgi:hypothetical protein